MYAALTGMLICFALVVVFRVDIRMRWWAYRLRHSTDAPSRMYYTKLLASTGERAVPVLDELLTDTDAGVRSFAVALLNSLKSKQSFDLLARACRDEDHDVRRNSIFGVSLRDSPDVLPFLVLLVNDGDEETAMIAASRLEGLGHPGALAALKKLATQDPRPAVRAQAIQSLATWALTETADVLVKCLEDNAVYVGRTETERTLREALSGAAPTMAGSLDTTSPQSIVGPPGETNGSRAARVLRALAGQDFGYLGATPAAREAAIQAWRQWLAARSDS